MTNQTKNSVVLNDIQYELIQKKNLELTQVKVDTKKKKLVLTRPHTQKNKALTNDLNRVKKRLFQVSKEKRYYNWADMYVWIVY